MAASHDEAFFALPEYLQRRIDSAFFSTIRTAAISHINDGARSSEPPTKRQRLNSEDIPAAGGGGFVVEEDDHTGGGGGGFILDDQNLDSGAGFLIDNAPGNDSNGGGGFLIEESDMAIDPDSASEENARMPLSFVPRALQLLELDTEDQQVLAVFQNAASGWDRNVSTAATDVDALTVTLRDWRAVCSILLEPGTGDSGENDSEGGGGGFIPYAEDDDPSSDFDMHNEDDDDDDEAADSDDDYEPGPSSSKSSRRARSSTKADTATVGGKRHSRASRVDLDSDESELEDNSKPRLLNSRQEAACLEAFAMFFTGVESEEALQKRRIKISDIQYVSKLLGEKLKAEEMLDMLEVFSSSPDKSMSLQDFERMMVAAKLV
ncbi:hypothetical protein D9757_006080 [Collybiopsis confluens]|uniref:Uncharacterized protein n=1 Tax=Collybiopsis confluens TaxID=2823264 RepID=A0A8H5M7F3_9AGAR|nr:hypothetical protein D9757_006080 [Collybiopsis confluens]